MPPARLAVIWIFQCAVDSWHTILDHWGLCSWLDLGLWFFRFFRFLRLRLALEQTADRQPCPKGQATDLIHQPEPRQPGCNSQCEQKDRDQQKGCCRQIEKPNHGISHSRTKHPARGSPETKHGIERQQAGCREKDQQEATEPHHEQRPVQVQGIVAPPDKHQRVAGDHHRKQIGDVAEEIHEQAGEPGAGTSGIVLDADVMTNAGPARI